jgi:hypothetical protein
MSRCRLLLTKLLVLTSVAGAATLERLSLDDMILKSTEIVRGRVVSSSVIERGPVLYTVSRVQILEGLKGALGSHIDVAVRGGSSGGQRQTFSGAPELKAGAEYVLFLWTGRSGLTHVIGFSQGVFDVRREKNGQTFASRAPIKETLLDPSTKQEVEDHGLSIPLEELLARIRRIAAEGRR